MFKNSFIALLVVLSTVSQAGAKSTEITLLRPATKRGNEIYGIFKVDGKFGFLVGAGLEIRGNILFATVGDESAPVAISKLSSSDEEIQNFLKGDFFSGMTLKTPAPIAMDVITLENSWAVKWAMSEWERSDIGVPYRPGSELSYKQTIEVSTMNGSKLCFSPRNKWTRGACNTGSSEQWIVATYGKQAKKLFSK